MAIEVTDVRQLRAVRAALGFSLAQMGEAAGLHKNTVFVVERSPDIKFHRYAATAIALAGWKAGVRCEMLNGEPVIRFAAS